MTSSPTLKSKRKEQTFHLIRVSIFVVVILLIHFKHGRTLLEKGTSSISQISIEDVRSFFPNADQLSPAQGSLKVFDAHQNILGEVLKTSPQSDHIIGFSGPSDVLIALDGEKGKILGFKILSSRDTRDHVDAVLEDEFFFNSLNGVSPSEVAQQEIDGVSGATLTSHAIIESIIHRLGGERTSLKFPEEISIEDAKKLFPEAQSLLQDSKIPSKYQAFDASGAPLGSILRSSPYTDSTIGYQGPTETLIGFNPAERIIGMTLRKSYDNEPYVGYVKDDQHFKESFKQLSLSELAQFNLAESEIEGVSGATMTSMAVAEGLIKTGKGFQDELQRTKARKRSISIHEYGTLGVIIYALIVSLTRLRTHRVYRLILQILLIAYLGLTVGYLVSQASVVGWTQSGFPWKTAPGFVLLSFAAFLLPITFRKNIYCSHLCPHGAAQQLLMKRIPQKWRIKLSPRWNRSLKTLPPLLLFLTLSIAMGLVPLSLVDIEGFDAWLFKIAGPAAITIGVSGLIASLFIPMAYCRYGCPTGLLLNFVKLDSRSGSWTKKDWVALIFVLLAVTLYFI